MTEAETIARLERRLARERAAREEAERLLEDKARDLFVANETLRKTLAGLERTVAERTQTLAEESARRKVAMDEAVAASRAKSEFLSSMSHELRTPLNAILGFAQLLRDSRRNPVTDQQRKHLDQIIRSGDHLLALIDDILDLSRIDAGRLDLNPVTLDTVSFLRDCQTAVQTQATAAGITVLLDLGESPLPPIHADQTRARQVLLNLLSNAIKYNRPGGSVRVTAEATAEGVLRIAVTDTGIGIPAGLRHALFEPFERLGQEAGAVQGTGIGLTITRRLVEAMDGTIDVASQEGVGSTFRVDLPLALSAAADPVRTATATRLSGPAPETAPEDAPPTPAARPERRLARPLSVLCVEDNPVNRMMVEEVAATITGLSLVTAVCAEDALALAMAETPGYDLVLMDINLPGMDGHAALRALRALPHMASVPVVALSASAMPDAVAEGLRNGFARYMTKPVRVETLVGLFLETAATQLEAPAAPGPEPVATADA